MGRTIKGRITFWYMMTIMVITITCILLMYGSSNKMTEAIMKERLKTASQLAETYLDYGKDGIQVLSGMADITEAELLVLDDKGHVLYGQSNTKLRDKPKKNETYFQVEIDESQYCVYDHEYRLYSHHPIWIRSYASLTSVHMVNQSVFQIGILLLPILILIATIGGFILTKKAFHPIGIINQTAKDIAQSGDLTKRIVLSTKNKDELSELTNTFNEMFDQLQIAFENQRQFTSDASHELRTPVTVVLAQAEYLNTCDKEHVNVKSSKERRATETILRQAERMNQLIQELLMISRMDNNNLVIHEEMVDVSELMMVIGEEMEEQAKEKTIQIQTEIEDNIILHTDQTMIMRVLVNLIENAIKYGKEGGYVKLKATEDGRAVHICIEDNGIGISPEHLHDIWKRFYQVDSARASGGNGLGLFMVQWIVKRLGGLIWVESEYGKGSQFFLDFWKK